MTGAFSRRSFLATTALGVASGCRRKEPEALDASTPVPPPQADAQPLPSNALATLEAAMARILPTDEDPGAREARCIDFLAKAVEDPALVVLKKQMRTLARVLDVAARKNGGAAFEALDAGSQDEILSRAQQRTLPAPRGFDTGKAFRVLVTFALEGFLSDPMHGGNRDEVGWKLAQFFPHGGHAHHAHSKDAAP